MTWTYSCYHCSDTHYLCLCVIAGHCSRTLN